MQPHIPLPASPPIYGGGRSKSLFERRLNEACRVQWASEETAVQEVAQRAAGFFHHAESVLSPIIGLQGVGALYQRSLYLARAQHPWLAGAYGEQVHADAVVVLQKTLARQSLQSATAAVQTLRTVFRELLNTLVGSGLSTQLLGRPMV